jgi:hypothetical protein
LKIKPEEQLISFMEKFEVENSGMIVNFSNGTPQKEGLMSGTGG